MYRVPKIVICGALEKKSGCHALHKMPAYGYIASRGFKDPKITLPRPVVDVANIGDLTSA
jgi:hypothetical protein